VFFSILTRMGTFDLLQAARSHTVPFMRLLAQILDKIDPMEGVGLASSESTASGPRESRRYNIFRRRLVGASACRIEPILTIAVIAARPNPMPVLVRDKTLLEELSTSLSDLLVPSFSPRHACSSARNDIVFMRIISMGQPLPTR
jgi:hypothetical protein